MTDDIALLRAQITYLGAKLKYAEMQANQLTQARLDFKATLDALNEENATLRTCLKRLRDKTTVNSNQIELIDTALREI